MSKNKNNKVSNKRERIFGSPIRNLFFCALISALLGAAFLLQPATVYTYCGFAIGGLIGVIGLLYIIIYFCRKPVSGMYRSEFFIGFVALLIGAYVAFGGYLGDGVSASGIGFETIVKMLGILIAADGVLKLQYTLDVARMKYSGWWGGLIWSLLGIALGVATVLGIVYGVGDTLKLGGVFSFLGYSSEPFINGMLALAVAFCINCLLDLFTMIVIANRNRMGRRELAVEEATAMMANAREEEIESAIPAPVEYVPAPEAAPVEEPAVPEEPAAPEEA